MISPGVTIAASSAALRGRLLGRPPPPMEISPSTSAPPSESDSEAEPLWGLELAENAPVGGTGAGFSIVIGMTTSPL